MGFRAFSIERPRGRRLPVVVEVPHAGTYVDAGTRSSLLASDEAVRRDADLHVDMLVEACAARGATVLVSHVSRYVVDLNRAETDVDGTAVEGARGPSNPHGVIWHRGTDGARCLSAPLSPSELERRLADVHRPYHAALSGLLDEARVEHRHVVLVCAHSMPSTGRSPTGDVVKRADIVPGTRDRTSARGDLIAEAERTALRLGFSCRHDDPYKGGFSTGHYGRPDEGVSAIQIEVARRLYMSEATLAPFEGGVTRLQAFFAELVTALGATLTA